MAGLETTEDVRETVRERYAAAARSVKAGAAGSCCGGEESCGCGPSTTSSLEDQVFGDALYSDEERAGLPQAAKLASLGCGNPTAVAELHEGETVLDLGSGGGIDVLRKHAGKVCVCELVPLFDLSQPTVSHHLKVLREAGIVDSERRGLWAYYYVTPDSLKELSAWLS